MNRANADSRSPGANSARWTVVFVAIAMLLGLAALLVWSLEQQTLGPRPIPSASPGQNGLINVVQALRTAGLTVESVPGGVPVGELSVPGQKLMVDSVPVYVFVYPKSEDPAAELAKADRTKILGSSAATPSTLEALAVYTHSNVTVVFVGESSELRQRVERAVQSLV